MHAKEIQSQNNVWFGVSMFLSGLIVGVVLIFASGTIPFMAGKTAGIAKNTAPTAPQAPAPTAPNVAVEPRMIAYAEDLGIDAADFTACRNSGKFDDKITQQQAGGQGAGITGTPGNIIYDLKSKKGIIVSGAQPVANFQKVIDDMLKDPANAMAQPGVQLAGDVPAIDMKNDHVRGETDATIAIIEYSDYECPFCRKVHPTYLQLMDSYDGKIMWVYRHYPLPFHPEAKPLAIGAECAAELAGADGFWKFSDKVMAE